MLYNNPVNIILLKILDVFNNHTTNLTQCIYVGNKLIEIEVENEQEIIIENAEYENQLNDNELESMEFDKNHELERLIPN